MTDLPLGWREAPLAEVCQYVRGVTYGRSDASDKAKEGFLPLLRATNIADGRLSLTDFVYVPTGKVKPIQLLRGGDLVVAASSGSIQVVGKSAPAPEGFFGTFGAFCAVLRPNHDTNHQYLNYFISSPKVREAWSAAARGTNINNLKRESVLATAAPIPPLAEQQRIVEILEEQFSRLDAALASIRTVREKTSAFRRSLLHGAFGQVVSDGVLLGEVATVIDCEHKTAPKTDEVPFAFSLGTSSIRSGNIRFDRSKPISRSTFEEWTARRVPEEGDLVLTREAPMGEVAIVPQSPLVALGQRTVLVHLEKAHISPKYMHLMLLSPRIQSWIKSHSVGTTVQHLNVADVKKIPLGELPSLREQQRVVQTIEKDLSRLDFGAVICSQLDGRIASERRSLLHAAFSGALTAHWRELHRG